MRYVAFALLVRWAAAQCAVTSTGAGAGVGWQTMTTDFQDGQDASAKPAANQNYKYYLLPAFLQGSTFWAQTGSTWAGSGVASWSLDVEIKAGPSTIYFIHSKAHEAGFYAGAAAAGWTLEYEAADSAAMSTRFARRDDAVASCSSSADLATCRWRDDMVVWSKIFTAAGTHNIALSGLLVGGVAGASYAETCFTTTTTTTTTATTTTTTTITATTTTTTETTTTVTTTTETTRTVTTSTATTTTATATTSTATTSTATTSTASTTVAAAPLTTSTTVTTTPVCFGGTVILTMVSEDKATLLMTAYGDDPSAVGAGIAAALAEALGLPTSAVTVVAVRYADVESPGSLPQVCSDLPNYQHSSRRLDGRRLRRLAGGRRIAADYGAVVPEALIPSDATLNPTTFLQSIGRALSSLSISGMGANALAEVFIGSTRILGGPTTATTTTAATASTASASSKAAAIAVLCIMLLACAFCGVVRLVVRRRKRASVVAMAPTDTSDETFSSLRGVLPVEEPAILSTQKSWEQGKTKSLVEAREERLADSLE